MKNNDLLIPLVRDEQFNWSIFKRDVQNLVENVFKYEANVHNDKYVKFRNDLFSAVGLSFKDGVAFAIATSTKMFDTEREMSDWLKLTKPLVHSTIRAPRFESRGEYFMSDSHLNTSDRLKDLKPESVRYIVRYFEDVGKLPVWKYYMQWFFGKYNFKLIRPFLYRMFVIN